MSVPTILGLTLALLPNFSMPMLPQEAAEVPQAEIDAAIDRVWTGDAERRHSRWWPGISSQAVRKEQLGASTLEIGVPLEVTNEERNFRQF